MSLAFPTLHMALLCENNGIESFPRDDPSSALDVVSE